MPIDLTQRALGLMRRGRFAEVIQLLESHSAKGCSLHCRVLLADALQRVGQNDRAAELCNGVIRTTKPTPALLPHSHFVLGNIQRDRGPPSRLDSALSTMHRFSWSGSRVGMLGRTATGRDCGRVGRSICRISTSPELTRCNCRVWRCSSSCGRSSLVRRVGDAQGQSAQRSPTSQESRILANGCGRLMAPRLSSGQLGGCLLLQCKHGRGSTMGRVGDSASTDVRSSRHAMLGTYNIGSHRMR